MTTTLRHFLFAVALSALLAAAPGCTSLSKWTGGWFGLAKKKAEAPEATLPSWVGRIAMVDAENNFALIDTGATLSLPPDKRLLAFREQQRTAVLKTTGESRPPFLAAQLIEGLPALDDQVAMDESHPAVALPAH